MHAAHPADRPANRLLHASSPYLQQHAYNPVDWHEWGPHALELAREQDRPIFLSIGYAACHWCHVMERESFENPAIAAIMNRLFVNIKVDREQRPDLDEIYMAATTALNNGQGGWPMSVWLTPGLRPFFAGTYFPPVTSPQYGRIGFGELCERIGQAWKQHRAELETDSQRITDHIQRRVNVAEDAARTPAACAPGEASRQALQILRNSFDPQHGGFGGAPKFPPHGSLELLLYAYAVTRECELLEMIEITLDRMARGGIHDQLAGGFARYSVDDHWLIPHFEKMLYDNAQLLGVYARAAALARTEQRTADAQRWEAVTDGIASYLLTDLRLPGGAFASSEDADSEGEEGRFYVFTPAQVMEALGDASAAAAVCAVYGVSEEGNFEHTGSSALHLQQPLAEQCAAVDPAWFQSRWPALRDALLAYRNRRPRPLRDDKVIAAWNGMAIAALATAARLLQRPAWLAPAAAAMDFIQHNLWDSRCGLLRCWRATNAAGGAGKAEIPAYLDDHAHLLQASIDLLQARYQPALLNFARSLADALIERFFDPTRQCLYFTPHDQTDLIVRTRDDLDNATPASTAIAIGALLSLAGITGEQRYKAAAENALQQAWPAARTYPHAAARLLIAEHQLRCGQTEVVTVCPEADLDEWRSAAASVWMADGLYLHLTDQPSRPDAASPSPPSPAAPANGLETLPLLLQGRVGPAAPSPRGYLCHAGQCAQPADSPAELARQLRARWQAADATL